MFANDRRRVPWADRRHDHVVRTGSAPADGTRPRDELVAAQFSAATSAAGYAHWHQFGPGARYSRSRIHLIMTTLANIRGGNLLDVGCGPGLMVRELLQRRPADFRIVALDRSPAMVAACAQVAGGRNDVTTLVGRIEAMPFAAATFDVVLAMGVLEYVNLMTALAEIARVTKPGGLVMVTMLNPTSPYRLIEWHVYPALMRMGNVLTSPEKHRPRDPRAAGIHAYRAPALREKMLATGLRPIDLTYYDVTVLVPPIDRILHRWTSGWPGRAERAVGRGMRKWLGTAYMIAARRAG
jgi:ubiquinone/menaquinone biosynthesis C-methylase UbiE